MQVSISSKAFKESGQNMWSRMHFSYIIMPIEESSD